MVFNKPLRPENPYPEDIVHHADGVTRFYGPARIWEDALDAYEESRVMEVLR